MSLLKVLLAVFCFVLAATSRKHHEHRETAELHCRGHFILGEPVTLVKTDAGEVRALLGHQEYALRQHNLALVFITVEPKAISLPHYMDAQVVFVIQQGEARFSFVQGKELVSKQLKAGDVYSIPAGIVSSVLNSHESQPLKILAALDTSNTFLENHPQTYFVAGGIEPPVVLSGFTSRVLAASLKVNPEVISHFLHSQRQGPFVRTTVDSSVDLASVLSNGGKKKHSKKDDEKKHKEDDKDEKHKKEDKKEEDEEDKQKHEEDEQKRKDDVFNLLERRAYESEHGWISSTLDEDVKQLQGTSFQVSAVRLMSGCLLAPHWNSRGSGFGIVTKGSGRLQISFPNGTNAADVELDVGSIFYVPQFLPSSQIASSHKNGDEESAMEFIVFTAERAAGQSEAGSIQYLAGEGSVLRTLDIDTLALSFDVPQQLLEGFLGAQEDSVIFPGPVDSGATRW